MELASEIFLASLCEIWEYISECLRVRSVSHLKSYTLVPALAIADFSTFESQNCTLPSCVLCSRVQCSLLILVTGKPPALVRGTSLRSWDVFSHPPPWRQKFVELFYRKALSQLRLCLFKTLFNSPLFRNEPDFLKIRWIKRRPTRKLQRILTVNTKPSWSPRNGTTEYDTSLSIAVTHGRISQP